MDVTDLVKHGIDQRIVDLWIKSGMGKLLPIQEQAVLLGKVLEGGSVIVSSPTSSGKTFVGEMAAIRVASRHGRVVYLAPQKALAEEKYSEFQRKYREFDIGTVISTRDRRENDHDIQAGNFHIAVVVFEKMQTLLVSNPDLLSGVDLVVIDELQMLGDEGRGAELELLLTKFMRNPKQPQFVGLSAVLGNACEMADWLGAKLCEDKKRPVELRRGVLLDGVFSYSEQNSRRDGTEVLFSKDGKPGDPDAVAEWALLESVAALVARGEQCLVFRKSRPETMEFARKVAERIKGKPCVKALEHMAQLEDSQGRDELESLLRSGVAYHNSDLDWDQRQVIEGAFRAGEIRVLCATSTLAMGVNLPCRNVFVDHEKWLTAKNRRSMKTFITQPEYENSSGRAGRLGFDDDFGRAILVATSDMQREFLHERYVGGALEDLQPRLDKSPLEWHVLNLVASQLCLRRREISAFLMSSYTGRRVWTDAKADFAERVADAVGDGLVGELLTESGGMLDVTEAGRQVAAKGIDIHTALVLLTFLDHHRGTAEEVEALEVLWALAGTPFGAQIRLPMRQNEVGGPEYRNTLQERITRLPSAAHARMELAVRIGDAWDFARRAKKTLLLNDWINDVPIREIERAYNIYSGNAASIGNDFSWLAETLAGLANAGGWPATAVRRFSALTPRLLHGVSADGVALASLRLPGLTRGRIKALVDEGLSTLEHLQAAPQKRIAALIPPNVADRLVQTIQRRHERVEAGELVAVDPPEDWIVGTVDAPEMKWEPAYPASGDKTPVIAGHSGEEYKTAFTIKVIGRTRSDRHLVVINGCEYWLTVKSFRIILVLAVAVKRSPLGWVDWKHIDANVDCYHQSIRRVKIALAEQGLAGTDLLIENNNIKQYRLSIPPSHVEIDKSSIGLYYPDGKEMVRHLRESKLPRTSADAAVHRGRSRYQKQGRSGCNAKKPKLSCSA